MNTSYVQIRNELASEQLIKVQFQVAMSGRYTDNGYSRSRPLLRISSLFDSNTSNRRPNIIRRGQPDRQKSFYG